MKDKNYSAPNIFNKHLFKEWKIMCLLSAKEPTVIFKNDDILMTQLKKKVIGNDGRMCVGL
jgi:hypothetical protein